MHDELSCLCAFLGEKMGTFGVGFDWWRAVDVFLRKCLVDRGLPYSGPRLEDQWEC